MSRRPHSGAVLIGIALFLGLSSGFLSSPSNARDTGKKLALLVGIDKYPSGSGFSSLPFPQRDVDQLAQLLLDSGYRPEHVRVLTMEKRMTHGGSMGPRPGCSGAAGGAASRAALARRSAAGTGRATGAASWAFAWP